MITSAKRVTILLSLSISLFIGSCKKDDNADNTINIFSIEDDKALGEQLKQEIAANPQEYPIIPRSSNPQAYAYLDQVTQKIFSSGKFLHKDDFEWEFFLIKNDSILNAFAGPGGKVYVYTGIVQYLDSGHHFAGVMGHEMAHADRRHVTDQLTKQYGISVLLDIVFGQNSGAVAQIAAGLAFLKFSRAAEAEADDFSVRYLCPTDYKADGAAGFFAKLIALEQAGNTPEFLSTHPSPENRVHDIRVLANELACPGTNADMTAWKAFQNSVK
jgi:beta-barrel assembly-enhancing protease